MSDHKNVEFNDRIFEMTTYEYSGWEHTNIRDESIQSNKITKTLSINIDSIFINIIVTMTLGENRIASGEYFYIIFI